MAPEYGTLKTNYKSNRNKSYYIRLFCIYWNIQFSKNGNISCRVMCCFGKGAKENRPEGFTRKQNEKQRGPKNARGRSVGEA